MISVDPRHAACGMRHAACGIRHAEACRHNNRIPSGRFTPFPAGIRRSPDVGYRIRQEGTPAVGAEGVPEPRVQ